MNGEMLSPHFSQSEMDCPCCGRCAVRPELLLGLEELRSLAGGGPVTILSACRCQRKNAAVGGTPHSQHLVADIPEEGPCGAADIYVTGKTTEEVLALAGQVSLFRRGGIGYYPDEHFVHVDVRTDGPARWARLKRRGPYVAIPASVLKGAGL
jgi:uncharacterized protein YcbK (DUF882 family)